MDMWKLFWHLQILRTAEHWEMSLGIKLVDFVVYHVMPDGQQKGLNLAQTYPSM